MAEELILEYQVDQPNIPVTNVETEVKVLLRVNAGEALRAMGDRAVVGANLCLVLDVSSSMRDREIKSLIDAAKLVVDEVRPIDRLSIVAFQSMVYEIVEGAVLTSPEEKAAVKRKLDTLPDMRGGGTDLEWALTKAEMLLNQDPDPSKARKIIVFTDGQVTGVPQRCLNEAARIAAGKTSIDCLGFGPEFDYGFCQELVRPSNGFTDKIGRPEEIVETFRKRVGQLQSAVATNVTLTLTFTPQVRAGRIYRYAPEIVYLGPVALPGDSRDYSIPIGNVERDREYAYLVTATVPQRPEGNIRVIKATLGYDVPALDLVGGESLQSVVVFYTSDAQKAALVNGDVLRAFDEAEIGRLVGELENATRAQDHKRAAMFFDVLAKRYEELGNGEMKEHYVQLKAKYQQSGNLSLEDMNYSRHKSTQKRDTGVKLVDASDLI
jgi:Ca-activated chloride channel family protein